MRLTTLARKVELSPTNLLKFLEENNVEISNGINTILDDEAVKLAQEKFLKDELIPTEDAVEVTEQKEPELQESVEETHIEDQIPETDDPLEEVFSEDELPVAEPINSTEEIEKAEAVDEIVSEDKEEPIVVPDCKSEPEDETTEISESKAGTVEDLESDPDIEIDLIKVKKVTLDGIKVVGKIDLPEKKEVATEDSDEEKKTEARKKRTVKKEEKPRKKLKSPLTYEERLKRIERQRRKELKKLARKEKENKKRFYEENIQPKTVTKTKKKKKKSSQNQARESVPVHKNPILRFWAWLNGKYDRY